MRCVLLKMLVNGIKCIDKEIELSFYKTTMEKSKFDNSKSHVKAIYGPNGAGKTGIIYAAEIYKNLLLNPSYLMLSNINDSMRNLVNQKTKEFYVKMIFACVEDTHVESIYSHLIVIKEIDGKFEIYEEKLQQLSGYNINITDKFKTIIHIKEGNIIEMIDKESESFLIRVTANLLKEKSFLSVVLSTNNINETVEQISNKVLECIYHLKNFANSLKVYMQRNDKNYIDFIHVADQISAINAARGKTSEDIFKELIVNDRIIQKNVKRVLRTRFDVFEKYIKNLASFIKVFKDDLLDIEIDKKENGDFYECDIILIYDDKRVDVRYESTGIKKIIDLYTALCDVDNGDIVFIDEFDANIHDVLLIKLVEYIKNYAIGQLIFTTHNLGPMDVLQKEKKSIDFLTSDSKLITWKISGNNSASSLYRKGLIEYSPFNIESFSFLGKFGEK